MRIGLRRLRSALGLFGKLIPCPPVLRTELAWLGTALGEARDWEVLATATLSSMQNAALRAPKLAGLRHAALQVAQARRQRAAAAVDSVRYARLVLALGAWMVGMHWRDAATADRVRALSAPLRKFAAKKLARLHQTLFKRGEHLKSGAGMSAAWHRVRIAAKKLRYAAEFFKAYFAGRQSRALVAALASLQDVLGRLNDVAVASRLLRDLAHMQADLAKEANFVRGCLDAGAQRDVRKLHKRWRAFVRL